MDRFRSMPMAPSAIVVGRSLADMVNAVLGLVVMVLCGLAVGWGWHDGARQRARRVRRCCCGCASRSSGSGSTSAC